MSNIKKKFINLNIKKLRHKDLGKKYYRIYKAKKEYIDIEAETAYEAVQKSQIEKPVKIKFTICGIDEFIRDSKQLEMVKTNEEPSLESENKSL